MNSRSRWMVAFVTVTMTAWIVAVGCTVGIMGRVLPVVVAPSACVVASVIAWAVERRNAQLRYGWRGAIWLLYATVLAATSAWYVSVRGRFLLGELLLPTIVALLLMVGLRSLVESRCERGPGRVAR